MELIKNYFKMDINDVDLDIKNENENKIELIIKEIDNKSYKLIIKKEKDEIKLKSKIIDDIFDNEYKVNINLKQFYNINKIFRKYESINDIYLKYFNNIKGKNIIICLNKNRIELKYQEEKTFILEPNKLKYENIIIKLCDKVKEINNINNEMNNKIENNNLKNKIIINEKR